MKPTLFLACLFTLIPAAAQAATVATYNGNLLASRYDSTCGRKTATDYMDKLSMAIGKISPADCGYAATNPLIIEWPQDASVDTSVAWKITIRKAGTTVVTGTNVFPHYQLTAPLAAGTYDWYVTYRNKQTGATMNSATRRFTVRSTAIAIPVITPAMIVSAAVSRPHPRLLPKGSTAAQVVARQVQPTAAQPTTPYKTLLAEANKILSYAISAEPLMKYRSEFATDYDYQQWKLSLTQLSIKESSRLGYLGYVSMLTGNTSMRAAGIKRLTALADWEPGGPTSNSFNDQANREVLLGLAEGYDYFHPYLTATQRSVVMSAIKARMVQVVPLIKSIHNMKGDSHGRTIIGFMLSTLLLLAGDPAYPEAANYLRDTYSTFLVTNMAFGSNDGAFMNGNGYGWFFGGTYEKLTAIKAVTGYDLSYIPYLRKYGDYLIAFTAPLYGMIMTPFGDDHEAKTHYQMYVGDVEPLALLTKNPAYQWYYTADSRNVNPYKLRQPTYFTLRGMGNLPVTPAAPTANSAFFPEAGLASLMTRTSDPMRSSVAFRSSNFGSFNHSHADQNAFTLVSSGRDMLISSGYYPWYNSPHHAKVARATRYHNAMTFDGGIGQAEKTLAPTVPGPPAYVTQASGEILNGGDVNGVAIVTGDATKAYRATNSDSTQWAPLLSNAIRSIAYFRAEKITVIYDWATSAAARLWELNYHAVKPFTLAGSVAKVVNDHASICIQHYDFPSTLRTWSGFDVPTEGGEATQYHLRATAASRTTELTAVTVIKENCSTTPVSVSMVGTEATVTIGARGSRFNRKVVEILQN